jgi:hypothetical protein
MKFSMGKKFPCWVYEVQGIQLCNGYPLLGDYTMNIDLTVGVLTT